MALECHSVARASRAASYPSHLYVPELYATHTSLAKQMQKHVKHLQHRNGTKNCNCNNMQKPILKCKQHVTTFKKCKLCKTLQHTYKTMQNMQHRNVKTTANATQLQHIYEQFCKLEMGQTSNSKTHANT
jgi:hypothetical protein